MDDDGWDDRDIDAAIEDEENLLRNGGGDDYYAEPVAAPAAPPANAGAMELFEGMSAGDLAQMFDEPAQEESEQVAIGPKATAAAPPRRMTAIPRVSYESADATEIVVGQRIIRVDAHLVKISGGDANLVAKVIQHRLAGGANRGGRHKADTGLVAAAMDPIQEAAYLLDRPPLGRRTMEVVLEDGTLCYLACHDNAPDSAPGRASYVPPAASADSGGLGVLSVPIAQLLREIDCVRLKDAVRVRPQRASVPASTTATGHRTGGSGGAAALWVDKHAPREFVDLLSSEAINRAVLKWVKMWDARVFSAARGAIAGPAAAAAVSGHKRPSTAMSGFFAGSAKKDSEGATAAAAATAATSQGGTYFKRPPPPWERNRVLLLSGPPGSGKTTLAHIVARQAGYRPLELNASDDRSAKVVRERIAAAQQMRDVNGGSRPNLVILDEIDGMEAGPHGGVTELVRIIKATPPFAELQPQRAGWNGTAATAAAAAEDDDEGDDAMADGGAGAAAATTSTSRASVGKRRGAKAAPQPEANGDADDGSSASSGSGSALRLSGPVICICNDQFAPALRELRPLAYCIEMGRAGGERLVARLKHVARAEGLHVANDALAALVAVTDHDVRASLNTLHFLKYSVAQQQLQQTAATASTTLAVPRLTTELLTRAAVGLKDQSQAVFDLWQDLFRSAATPLRALSPAFARSMQAQSQAHSLAGLSRAPGAAAAAPLSAARAYSQFLSDQMSAYAAEPRLLLSGLHENLLTATRAADPDLAHASAALDWLCYGEELAARVAASQQYALAKYLPLAGLGFHLHAASELQPGKLAWPRAEAAARRRQEARRAVLDALLTERAVAPAAFLPPCGAMDRRALVLDALSPLVSIASPRLRPVQFSLLNSREKRAAQDLVEALASSGLTYAQRSNDSRFDGDGDGGSFGGSHRGFGGASKWILKPCVRVFSACLNRAPPRYPAAPSCRDISLLLTYDAAEAGLGTVLASVVPAQSPWGAASTAAVDGARADDADDAAAPRVPLVDMAREWAALEVRKAHIRCGSNRRAVATAADSEAAPAPDGGASSGAAATAPLVQLPAHVKTLKASLAAAAAATTAAASKLSTASAAPAADSSRIAVTATAAAAADAAAIAVARAPLSSANFLATVAQRSRDAELSRKRTMVAALQTLQAPLQQQHTAQHHRAGIAGIRYPVVYRFQEGFTNAVRRPTRLEDFL